jgi:predicted RecB family nuclease
MSAHEFHPPEPSRTSDERTAWLISRAIIEGYHQCRLKAYLKLGGLEGTKSDYETLMMEVREDLLQRASVCLANRHQDGELLTAPLLVPDTLARRASLILNAVIRDGEFALTFDCLRGVNDPSTSGNYHYVPVLVFEGEKVRKVDREVLEVLAFVLGRVQKVEPKYGVIVYGSECRQIRVHFKSGLVRASQTIGELSRFRGADTPPPLVLNDHCQVCEFRQRCLDQAKAHDDISLMRGMSGRIVKKFKKRGITTVTQLSCTFRPRKDNKREVKNKRPHSFGLQALAIRDGKTYVYGTTDLPKTPVRIYVDMEGDPERNFVYLIGVVTDNDGEQQRYSFWSDDETGEEQIFEQLLDLLSSYNDYTLFSYGRYETLFLKKMRTKSRKKRVIDAVLERSVNLLQVIYGKVYFPAYSNGLKDIATALGFSWTEKDASGVQSLVWRHRWERGGGDGFKNKLLTYNIEDCLALKRATEVVYRIAKAYGEQGTVQPGDGRAGDITWAKATEAIPDYRKWCRVRFACPDFDFINKCSYFDYQRQKIQLRRSGAMSQVEKRRRERGLKHKLRISQSVVLRARKCPVCGGPVHPKGDRIYRKQVYDLRITRFGASRKVTECRAYLHHCPSCDLLFLPRKFKMLDRFGQGLKSWAMYLHVAHQISFPKLETIFKDLFGLKVDASRVHWLKMVVASYHSPTAKRIVRNLLAGGVIYADETEVKLKRTKGYIWVLSNTEEVLYLFRSSREVDFLAELLDGFSGVLVTDFYSAYDIIKCAQQKCLVHLIRDLNAGLMDNPFDDDFKRFAFEFGRLLRSIVTTIDGHGLKKRYLARHRREVDRFYKDEVRRQNNSEATTKFQERFLKYEGQLFQFLDHSGVAWNNNYAEHAIKQFAQYRVISDGNMNESGIESYLVLLSVSQSCKNKGVGLLNFLLSGEQDIDSLRPGVRRKRRMPSIAVLPKQFYSPWQGPH